MFSICYGEFCANVIRIIVIRNTDEILQTCPHLEGMDERDVYNMDQYIYNTENFFCVTDDL